MKLVNNTATNMDKGNYVLLVELASGTSKLQLKTSEMNDFIDVPETDVTESTILNVNLPLICQVRAVSSDAATNVILEPRK